MTIDWLTVGAQMVNFLALVYLLKRFLYGPIVRAMTRREEAIAAQLREVAQQREAAEAEARRHREAREALEADRERLRLRAHEEADELKRTLEKELRQEIDETRLRWRGEIERDQATFLRDVRRRTVAEFETLARKALGELASVELESQMARVLVDRLGELDDARRAAFLRAGGAGEPLRVRSAFELPAAVKRSLTSGLRDALGADVEVTYEQAADVVCGVELRAGGESVAWSLEGYLDALERRLADGLGDHAAARPDEKPR